MTRREVKNIPHLRELSDNEKIDKKIGITKS